MSYMYLPLDMEVEDEVATQLTTQDGQWQLTRTAEQQWTLSTRINGMWLPLRQKISVLDGMQQLLTATGKVKVIVNAGGGTRS